MLCYPEKVHKHTQKPAMLIVKLYLINHILYRTLCVLSDPPSYLPHPISVPSLWVPKVQSIDPLRLFVPGIDTEGEATEANWSTSIILRFRPGPRPALCKCRNMLIVDTCTHTDARILSQ